MRYLYRGAGPRNPVEVFRFFARATAAAAAAAWALPARTLPRLLPVRLIIGSSQRRCSGT